MDGLDKRKTVLYSAASIGTGAFFAFNNFVLPPLLKGFGAPDLLTGLLASTRSIEGVVIQPTVGAISDRIWTPLGRRRPFMAVGIPMLLSFAATVIGISERRDLVARKEHYPLRQYIRAVVGHGAAMRYLATLFVYQFGINAVLPYLTLFIIEDIHQTQDVAFALAGLTLLVTAISAVIAGKIAERVGTRLVLAAGWAILIFGAIGGTLVHELAPTIVVVVVAGIGNGAATAMSWPLLTELVPPDETGVFAGLKAASESVAIPLSVV